MCSGGDTTQVCGGSCVERDEMSGAFCGEWPLCDLYIDWSYN